MSQAGLARVSSGSLPPSVPLQFTGDNGTIAIPVGNNITIYADNASNNSGSTVKFFNSGDISLLQFTDVLLNTNIGQYAGNLAITGERNVLLGFGAGNLFSTENDCVAIGYRAMGNSTISAPFGDCVAIGSSALQNVTGSAVAIVAIGSNAMQNSTSANDTVAIGFHCLALNTDIGGSNTAIGAYAMSQGVNGSSNVCVGSFSGNQVSGVSNVFLGATSASTAGNVSFNICIGDNSGFALGGNSNIFISNAGVFGESNTIRLGTDGATARHQNKCYVAGILGNTVTGDFVNISSSGQLGVVASGGIAQTITGNTGGAIPPSAGNWNIITANSTVKFAGSGSTETLDFLPTLNNIVLGSSMPAVTIGNGNVGMGQSVFQAITSGNFNVSIGTESSAAMTDNVNNVAVGYRALLTAISGATNNTAIGNSALLQVTTGKFNIAVGSTAGDLYTSSESSNIMIGHTGVVGESHVIRIGLQGTSDQQQSDCYLAGILHTTSGRTRQVTVPGAYPYAALSTDDIISVDTTSAHTIQLPNAPSTGTTYVLKDVTGTAALFNISVTTPGGTVTIDGSTTYLMNQNYMSITVYFNGTNYFII